MDFDVYSSNVTRGIPCSRREKQDIWDELRDHLEMLKAEYICRGYPEEEAELLAMRTFGEQKSVRKSLIDSLPLLDRYRIRWIRSFTGLYVIWLVYLLLLTPNRFAERSFIRHREAIVPQYSYVFHNGVLFHTISRYIFNFSDYGFYITFFVLGGNILLYLPLGLCVPLVFPRLRRLFPLLTLIFVISVTVQLVQGMLLLGRFDVDDILLNCIGGLCGYGCYQVVKVAFRKYKQRLR